MPSAVNKPVNTYVFPELATYKKSWVPVLTEARKDIKCGRMVFLCNALRGAALLHEGKFKEPDEKECADIARYYAAAEEIAEAIGTAINDHYSVIDWLWDIRPYTVYDAVGYRLAWIDHIIMKCEGD